MNYKIRPGKKIETIGKVLNNEKPLISIITPHYNGYNTSLETANSVFSQTFPFFEWIIVDDGSTDKKSLDQIKKISKMDKRVKFFEKENGGPSLARDFAINKASKETKYIIFLDTDDIMDKTMLEVFYWALETHPEYSFVYTKMINFGDKEFIWEKFLTVERQKKENLITISSMIRKQDLLEVGSFGLKEKAMYEDWNLWLKLLAAGKKPIRLNAPVFWYRFSGTGELSKARKNHERAMEFINRTADIIKEDVNIIQYPRAAEKFPFVEEKLKLTLPFYEKDKRKTILFIIPWTIRGGADIFNLELIKRIDKKRFQFIVISTLPSENELWQEFNINADEYYDVSTFLDRKNYLNFIDYIVESRCVDNILVSHSSYGYALIPFLKSKYPKIPIIDYIHVVDYRDKRGGFARDSYNYEELIDATYTSNNFTSGELRKLFHKAKAETLYIGTDHKRFDRKKYNNEEIKKEYNLPENKKIITFVARMASEKRPELFIEIAKLTSSNREDVHFLLVGDGPLLNKVKQKIEKYDLDDKFTVLGMVDKPEKVYAVSDITVNCSVLEGLALTSYESLSMGVPNIVSDVGGQKELVDETVGKVISFKKNMSSKEKKEEPRLYYEAISEVLADLEKYKRNARKKIVNKFTMESMVDNFEIMFDKITSNKQQYDTNLGIKSYGEYLINSFDEYSCFVEEYYKNQLHILPKTEEQEEITGGRFKNIKIKMKKFGIKYNIDKEMNSLIEFLSRFFDILRQIKRIILTSLKVIVLFIKSIIPTIKILTICVVKKGNQNEK